MCIIQSSENLNFVDSYQLLFIYIENLKYIITSWIYVRVITVMYSKCYHGKKTSFHKNVTKTFQKFKTFFCINHYVVSRHRSLIGKNSVNSNKSNYRVSHCKHCKVIWFWEKEEKIFLIFLGTFFQENICTFWYLSWLSWKRNGKLWKITKFGKKWKKIEFFFYF